MVKTHTHVMSWLFKLEFRSPVGASSETGAEIAFLDARFTAPIWNSVPSQSSEGTEPAISRLTY
jgi:hypothetical protein